MAMGDRAVNRPMKARGNEQSPIEGDFASPRAEDSHPSDVTEAEGVAASPGESSGPLGDTSGAVADLDEFKRILTELELMTAAELGAFEVDPSLGVLGLARALVRAGRLTPYQSAAIYQKKTRGLLVGDYLILDKIGQGGMGVVFKARHRQSGRIGALKILPPSFARHRTAVMRFKREIEAAGRLKHPNLVAAIDASQDRSVHFLVMEYVAGTDLDRLVRTRGPMPVIDAIDCVIQAARGLEAAHAAGIVHRDIKPGNLMLESGGTIRVLDLGLARFVEASNPFGNSGNIDTRLTSSGICMGTVDYMAPEQAEDSRQADHRADIYSLGCTLFYLLTGREPFPGPIPLKRMMAHQQEPAPKLRAARPDAPIQLESVFQRMMAKDPADRPATMGEVITLLEPCKLAAQTAAALAPTPAGQGINARVPPVTIDQAQFQRPTIAQTELDRSIFTFSNEAEGQPVPRDLRLEDLGIDVGTDAPQMGGLALTETSDSTESQIARQGTWWWLHALQQHEVALSLLLAIGLVGALLARLAWFSGSGNPNASATVAADGDGGAAREVSDAGLGRTDPRSTRDGSARAELARFSTTGAASAADARRAIPKAKSTKAGAISPTTPPIAAASLPVASGPFVEVGRLIGHTHVWVEGLCALRDGRSLLTAGYDKSVRFWDLPTGRELRRLWHPGEVRPVAALPNGVRALTGCSDGWVRLWDLRTGLELRRLVRHSGNVEGVDVSPDGRLALSGGEDGVLQISDIEKGGQVRRFEAQIRPVSSVAFSPDGHRVLAGGDDGVLRLGTMDSSKELASLSGHERDRRIWSVAFSPDGRRAVTGSSDSSLIVWDLDRKRVLRRLSIKEEGWVRCVAFLPDGEHVAYGTHDGNLAVWDLATGDRRHAARIPMVHAAIALLPAGRVATAEAEGFVRIWQPSAELALAREWATSGHGDRALAEYDKAVTAQPDDARLLIERGRLLAELGRSSEADADFSRAAQLVPDNPQLFLDCGWWVAGPYSLALDTPNPTETDIASFPAKPPSPSGAEPRHWQRVGTTMNDLVEMRAISSSGDKNVACYALAIVHSVTQRNIVLLVGSDDQARVWLNGQRVLDSPKFAPPEQFAVGATLQPGRNTILAKVVNQGGGHGLFLKISTAPGDFLRVAVARKKWDDAARDYAAALASEPTMRNGRYFAAGGAAFAELGRWKEAGAAFERALEAAPENYWSYSNLLHTLLGQGDRASYSRVYQRLIEKFGAKTDPGMSNNLAWLAVLSAGAVEPPSRYSELLSRGRKFIDTKNAGLYRITTYGALLYRAGQYQGAINFLNRSIRDQKNGGSAVEHVFLAMAMRRLKREDAPAALKRASELAARDSASWDKRVELRSLLAEAAAELKPPPVP